MTFTVALTLREQIENRDLTVLYCHFSEDDLVFIEETLSEVLRHLDAIVPDGQHHFFLLRHIDSKGYLKISCYDC